MALLQEVRHGVGWALRFQKPMADLVLLAALCIRCEFSVTAPVPGLPEAMHPATTTVGLTL